MIEDQVGESDRQREVGIARAVERCEYRQTPLLVVICSEAMWLLLSLMPLSLKSLAGGLHPIWIPYQTYVVGGYIEVLSDIMTAKVTF